MINSLLGGIAALTVVAGLSGTALADGHEYNHDGHALHGGSHAPKTATQVSVDSAWARASPGRATTGGAYVSVTNRATVADRLVAIETPVAGRAEVHSHIDDNGIMRMRKIDAIDVAPGGTITMMPGGYHIMLMGLHKPLKKGDKIPITLIFEKAGKVTADVHVQALGSMGPMGGNPGGHGTHGDKNMKKEMKDGPKKEMGGHKH